MTDNPDLSQKIDTVGGRLRMWRHSNMLRLVDLAELIGVSQGSLSDLENDKSLPSAGTLTGLCVKTDLNIYWLLTGQGPITVKDRNLDVDTSSDATFMQMMQDKDLRKTVNRLVEVYKRGTPSQKAMLKGFLSGVELDVS
ncbi:MAG: helix-turn-helix transcriptional regulator [Nitrospina sp.]|nr:helix-turn-helix transcriptional regulator [Nitrospina sp.]